MIINKMIIMIIIMVLRIMIMIIIINVNTGWPRQYVMFATNQSHVD